MKKYILLTIISICTVSMLMAQSSYEALIFSQNQYEGTARFQGMGGAFAALGGDFTTLSINPAGSAIYRSPEMTITPTIAFSNASANYLSTKMDDSKARFGMGNFGLVSSFTTSRSEGLVSVSMGIGYNKLQNNTLRFSANGISTNSSLAMELAKSLSQRGVDYRDINALASNREWLAWETFLIDTIPGENSQYIAATADSYSKQQMGDLNQYYYRDQSGYVGEYAFNIGFNFSHRFYFGITIGLQDIENDFYEEYQEIPVRMDQFAETNFRGLMYRNSIITSGMGYNIKLGAIVRPVGGLRLGAYIHTPTRLSLTESWREDMYSFVFGGTFEESLDGYYDYRINTPLKWGGGIAYTFGTFALVSVDYEGVNYTTTSMRARDDLFVFQKDNDYLRENTRIATNVRAGLELKIDQISVRAGYAYYQNPEKDMPATHIGSVGWGYREGSFSLDAAYSFAPSVKQDYTLYEENPYAVSTDTFYSKLLVTFGFRF